MSKDFPAVQTPRLEPGSLAEEAIAIWSAAVGAVRGDTAVREAIEWNGRELAVFDEPFPLGSDGRIVVVGAGKAAPSMAHGLAEVVGRVDGWLNVPGDSIDQLPGGGIYLHASRPHGINLPTQRAVDGTREIRRLLQSSRPQDLVLVLLSGGGSSLLVEPIEGLGLSQKVAITQALSESGATIHELNAVRRCLSTVKGGGLLRGCASKQEIALVISDVLDNDLSVIASGPTVACEDPEAAAKNAQSVLTRLLPHRKHLLATADLAIDHWLRRSQGSRRDGGARSCSNYVLANNATAVDAAGTEAVRRGWNYFMMSHRTSEGDAADVGREMANLLIEARKSNGDHGVDCWIFGGEPTVDLRGAEHRRRGSGGRNQHLVAAAADALLRAGDDALEGSEFCLLSAGTDGEDGTSSVAGAWLDNEVLRRLRQRPGAVADALASFDSHTLCRGVDATLDCGPTGTNVCDVRILLRRPASPA